MSYKIEIGSETGIEADEPYSLSAIEKEKTWQPELGQKIGKKKEINFLKRMVQRVSNIMGGGTFTESNTK